MNSYSHLNCALLPMCKVFNFECRVNFKGKKLLKVRLQCLLGHFRIIFKTFNNNNLILKFKKFIYNASKYLRAMLKVSILKIWWLLLPVLLVLSS